MRVNGLNPREKEERGNEIVHKPLEMSPVTTQTQILMEKSGGKCIRERLSMKKKEGKGKGSP